MHTHEYQGQKLVHDHPDGDLPHGYFEHPEDGVTSPALRAREKATRDTIARVRLALGQGPDDRRKLDKIISLVKPF
jgi:hypothetical protein